ncbi:MAG: aminotransferase class V-fold PLP-dependent enzyme [Caldithrix sp.]|nr:aminotransferase class V-fold PLP-dependent enzyme [Caldithrix sp.]
MNVYLDYSATTPLAAEVNKAIFDWQARHFGNPSSVHRFGQSAKIKLEETRDVLANELGAQSNEIFFTSGGTESNNLALIGLARSLARRNKPIHVILSAIEHSSVREVGKYLQENGFRVDWAMPDRQGRITLPSVRQLMRSDTCMVSVMMVNNETGIINEVPEIAAYCREKGIVCHSDAVQAFGKIDINVSTLPVDLLSVSAHKIYGPKGCGALFKRQGIALEKTALGGGQESSLRGGTENLPGIVGLGKAVQLIGENKNDYEHARQRQQGFEDALRRVYARTRVIGQEADRSPFISKIAFPGINSESMLLNLDMEGIAVSVGSACSSGSIRPSHVLQAMQLPEDIVNSALRFSFGRYTTDQELQYTVNKIEAILQRLL